MIKDLLVKIQNEIENYVSIECAFFSSYDSFDKKHSFRVNWILSIHPEGEKIIQHNFETFEALEQFANSWIREQQGDFGKLPKDIENAEVIVIVKGEAKNE